MNGKWLKTEFKRAAAMLPGIVKKAALLLFALSAAIGLAVFCVALADKKQDAPDMKIGYSSDDSRLTDMLIEYVKDIESVKEIGSIEKMSADEGIASLQNGELDVFIELPDDIVGEIISGSNTPAKVYISDGGTVKNLLFKELADAAVGMLETAQAQIYAVDYILGDAANTDSELINELYGSINKFNLSAASERENLFKKKMLSVTENDARITYYASAALALYMLAAGIFFEAFFCHSSAWRSVLEKKLKASRLWQLVCGFLAGLLPMFIMTLMPIAGVSIAAMVFVKDFTAPVLSFSAFALMLLVSAFCVLYFMLIYKSLGKRQSALLTIGILAAVQGYMSGCIVPSALLPNLVYGIGKYLPAAYLKAAFRVIFTGDAHNFLSAALGLFAWNSAVFIANGICFCFDCKRGSANVQFGKADFGVTKGLKASSPVWVVFKRMILKKGILASLALMIASSAFISRLEDKSDTAFTVAVFDESGEYEKMLLAHEGLVRFYACESEEEVQKLVLKDKAECGYILPQSLTKDIISGRANRIVTVYEDSDSMCVPIVNEVVFNAVFRHASLEWYKNYMSGFRADLTMIEQLFDNQIKRGKTFGIELVALKENGVIKQDAENKRTYPVHMIVLSVVILCGVQGFLTALWDCKKGRFERRARFKLAALTVVIPMIAAGVAGIVCVAM